jgi:hypothetical protein
MINMHVISTIISIMNTEVKIIVKLNMAILDIGIIILYIGNAAFI